MRYLKKSAHGSVLTESGSSKMTGTSYEFLNRNWMSSQFNLYKYESAESRKKGEFPCCVMLCTLGMILFISLAVCVVVNQSIDVESIPVGKFVNIPEDDLAVFDNSSQFEDIRTTQISVDKKPLQPPKLYDSDEEKEPSNNRIEKVAVNETEYLLEREDSQPINLRHSRQKVKFFQSQNQRNDLNGITMAGIRDQIPRPPRSKKISRRHQLDELEHPRPFNFVMSGPLPSQFQKNKNFMSNYRDGLGDINNIQDILHQMQDSENFINRQKQRQLRSGIEISGKYRKLKGNGITRLFNTGSVSQSSNVANKHFYGDPLYPYKPQSPDEVNLLAGSQLNYGSRPFSRNPAIYEQSHTADLKDMYSKIIAASSHRQNQQQYSRDGNTDGRNKPFSLMLDVYPMHEDEHSNAASTRPSQKKKRKPILPLWQGSNLPYSFQLDNSYYNNMNFPQLQHNKFPQANNFYLNSYLHSQLAEQEANRYNQGFYQNPSNEEDKPSQIMVQLNLFPKRKGRQQNRTGAYDIISPVFDDRISKETDAEIRNSTREEKIENPNKIDSITKDSQHSKNVNSIDYVKELENKTQTERGHQKNGLNKSKNLDKFSISHRDLIKFDLEDAVQSKGSTNFSV